MTAFAAIGMAYAVFAFALGNALLCWVVYQGLLQVAARYRLGAEYDPAKYWTMDKELRR